MATQQHLDNLKRGIGYWERDAAIADQLGKRKLAAYYRKQIKQAKATIERNTAKQQA